MLERALDREARRLTPGLNYRDLLLTAHLLRLGGKALPRQLVGSIYTTGPGVTGSLRRLEAAGLVTRGVGADARTRPVTLTPRAAELRDATLEEWALVTGSFLERLSEQERAELYRLLVKGADMWDGKWPETGETEPEA